jgi:DNA primase
MLAQARPLWAQLPEGTLRLQVLGELARLGSLPAEELSRLWQAASAQRGGRSAATASEDGGPDDRSRPWQGSAAPASGGAGRFKKRWRDDPPLPPQPRRTAPLRPEDRVVHMLYGQPAWWDSLTGPEHALLHDLPAPHGVLVAWLERDLAEHGPRPWAVLRQVLLDDPALDNEHRKLANGDADPDATLEDFRRAVDVLLEKHLSARKIEVLSRLNSDPAAMAEFKAIDGLWREVKLRQGMVKRDD